MAKSQNSTSRVANQAAVTSSTPAPGQLQITVSGPAEHVMAALTTMSFKQPVTPLLCQQIAVAATNDPSATLAMSYSDLNMLAAAIITAYTERCALHLKTQTGYGIDPTKLPQDQATIIQQVAEAMYAATT